MRISFFFLFVFCSWKLFSQVKADAGKDRSFCINEDSLTLIGNGLNAGDTGSYQWKELGTGNTSNGRTFSKMMKPAGKYSMELLVIRISKGITYTGRDTVTVLVNGLPVIKLNYNIDTVCSGSAPVQLISNYNINDTNGKWSCNPANSKFLNGSLFDP